MNIRDAFYRAVISGMWITLPEFYGLAKIRPTDHDGKCHIFRWDGTHPSRIPWQPSVWDLLREDWMVVPDVTMAYTEKPEEQEAEPVKSSQ